MISYSNSKKETIPTSAIKIIGLGGAGANMLEQIALDAMEGGELLALNTDVRTLGASLAKDKIQLGINLTKGLGTGGDPELGQQAILEAEDELRAAIKGQRIVFLCTGLGGGTGSGAAPIIARIAREEGAFVVIFATMPFFFEGRRRREQAETALNQLAVLSHALVTFDNNRMGELVLAKQGVHEAFAAADKMISESIKAVIRLVVRPGLINVGLDDLITALRTTRSRCLFGSGIAEGTDRASKALQNALSSPLLDQGSLLNQAQSVLVHLSGGESLTLFEIELLMESLQKHVPGTAHILFGAAIDPSMGDSLSITLISALPEDELQQVSKETIIPAKNPEPVTVETKLEDIESVAKNQEVEMQPSSVDQAIETPETKNVFSAYQDETHELKPELPKAPSPMPIEEEPTKSTQEIEAIPERETTVSVTAIPEPKSRIPGKPLWNAQEVSKPEQTSLAETQKAQSLATSMKIDAAYAGAQAELSFDNAPKGRFEGENPNVFEGEDLDLPPFLRKKKS